MCVDEDIYSALTLLLTHAAFFCTWNNLSFGFPFSLSVSRCVWFFNRKQRHQSLGRWRKTTSLPCFQLSTNVLYFSSLTLSWLDLQLVAVLLMPGYYCCPLLAQGKYVSASLYLLCPAMAKNDLCFQRAWLWVPRKSVLPWKAMWWPLDSHGLPSPWRTDPYQRQGTTGCRRKITLILWAGEISTL